MDIQKPETVLPRIRIPRTSVNKDRTLVEGATAAAAVVLMNKAYGWGCATESPKRVYRDCAAWQMNKRGQQKKGPNRRAPLFCFVRWSLPYYSRRSAPWGVLGWSARLLRLSLTLMSWRILSEGHPRERHTQRHHECRDQQRSALSHCFSPPFPFLQNEKPANLSMSEEVASCATSSPSLLIGAHLYFCLAAHGCAR
jgi:hypothetical protein